MADKVRFVDSSITISPGGNTGGGGGNNEGTLVIANPTYDGPNILNTIRVGTTLFKIEGSNNNTNGIFTDLNNSKSTTNDLQITGSLSISNPNPNILFDVGDSDFFTNPSNSNGKPKFFVTNNTTSYNAFLNGRLFLGQNGFTPEIYFGSNGAAYTVGRIPNGITVGVHTFETGKVSIFKDLLVGEKVIAQNFQGIFEGAISSSEQIASDISGAFGEVSSSFDVRITSNGSNISTNNTLITDLQSHTASYATTGSNVFKSDQIISGSLKISGSLLNTGTVLVNNGNGSPTSPYTITETEHFILIDPSGGNITINLPDAATYPGRQIFFKLTQIATPNIVALECQGSDTIDGNSNYEDLDDQFESTSIVSDGSTGWFIF
tara:strand:- start:717 stop:1850 length:1134 start_codon:yes stop_codon:yes gene_type:complete